MTKPNDEKACAAWDDAYFVGFQELLQRWSVSRRTVYRYIKKEKLPKPQKITERRVGWPRPVIKKFLESLGLGPII